MLILEMLLPASAPLNADTHTRNDTAASASLNADAHTRNNTAASAPFNADAHTRNDTVCICSVKCCCSY